MLGILLSQFEIHMKKLIKKLSFGFFGYIITLTKFIQGNWTFLLKLLSYFCSDLLMKLFCNCWIAGLAIKRLFFNYLWSLIFEIWTENLSSLNGSHLYFAHLNIIFKLFDVFCSYLNVSQIFMNSVIFNGIVIIFLCISLKLYFWFCV